MLAREQVRGRDVVAQGLSGMDWCCLTVLRSEENAKNRGGLKRLQEALGDPQGKKTSDREKWGEKNESYNWKHSAIPQMQNHT